MSSFLLENFSIMKKIILQKGKEKSLQRFHPWVFSGAVAKKDKTLADGDVVAVYNFEGQFMAVGHYHNSSTCVKIFSFEEVVIFSISQPSGSSGECVG